MNEENIPLYFNEEIKPIEEYEGLYSITSYGRVWSHEKIRRFGNNYRIYKAKFLKHNLGRGSYKYIILSVYNKRRTFKIHRLVAQHFIPNPYNLPEVNHCDGNKPNCREDNLEWSTFQDNQNHALVNGLKPKKSSKYYGVHFNIGFRNRNKPWVAQTTMDKKHVYIGGFKTEIKAACAYNNFIIEHNLNRPLNELV